MQSVFKLHIALAVLSEIDKGKFSLDQKIKIEQKDLLPGLYSPLREKYPNGAALKLSEILEYTVSQSDNVGCDVLLRLIGGPQAVEDFFIKNNLRDVSIKSTKK
jgi:beta-lactamase class A/beta-lactamase class A VEB